MTFPAPVLTLLHQLAADGEPQAIILVLDGERRVKEFRLASLPSVAALLSLEGLLPTGKGNHKEKEESS